MSFFLFILEKIYRHGDRTPIEPYPNDPWGDAKYWPTGWGQLTNVSKDIFKTFLVTYGETFLVSFKQ